jgi:hypothetical protein
MTRDQIQRWLEDEYPDVTVLLADGFEDAFVGLSLRFGREPVAEYDYDKCIGVLMERDGMGHSEAVEFFEFNTIGAWVGDMTPTFSVKIPEEYTDGEDRQGSD